jgi:hypothetical protein
MAARVKKQKRQLIKFSREELFEEYFEDMRCIACVSTLQPYQFAHTMNLLLDRDFRLELDDMQDKAGKSYKIYFDTDIVRTIDYNIICNRNRTDFLIPELLNSDFLVLMKGMDSHSQLYEQTLSQLQSNKKISYSYDFNPFQLKSKEYLVL